MLVYCLKSLIKIKKKLLNQVINVDNIGKTNNFFDKNVIYLPGGSIHLQQQRTTGRQHLNFLTILIGFQPLLGRLILDTLIKCIRKTAISEN